MAGAKIAYGEITILDLSDTATYIYYADNEAGGGVTSTPTANSKYIGFYSGPTLGDAKPDIPTPEQIAGWQNKNFWSGWISYIGPQGEPGTSFTRELYYAVSEDGTRPPTDDDSGTAEPFEVIENVHGEAAIDFQQGSAYSFFFSQSTGMLEAYRADGSSALFTVPSGFTLAGPSTVWLKNMPSLSQSEGKFIWYKYIETSSDGNSTITYTVTRTGGDARVYEVNLSHPTIKRVVTAKGIEFIPEILEIRVYDFPKEENSPIILFGEENELLDYTFSFLNEATGDRIELKDRGDFLYMATAAMCETNPSLTRGTLYFEPNVLYQNYAESLGIYQSLQDTSVNSFFRFSLVRNMEGINKEAAIQIIECENGVTSNLASFNIHSLGFNAAIENTTLEFSESGLALGSGDLTIQRNVYTRATGAIKPKVQYYIKNPNAEGHYLKAYPVSSLTEAEYYVRNGETVFYANDKGDLTLRGTIYAENGEFSGRLSAPMGTIGGFNLEKTRLVSTQNKNFYLDGSQGVLGINEAIVYNKMSLQDSEEGQTKPSYYLWLTKPTDSNEHLVLESKNLLMYGNGKIKVGNIEIDAREGGESAFIRHVTSAGTTKWQIEGNGHASFEDVYADNAHILNTILEVGKVSAVGSVMLFNDSFTVKAVNKTDGYIEIDGLSYFKPDDWIYIGNPGIANLEETYIIAGVKYRKIGGEISDTATNNVENTILYFDGAEAFEEGVIFSRFGNPETDCILYALGQAQHEEVNGHATGQKHFDFAAGNSFGITKFKQGKEGTEYVHRLVLGNLSKAIIPSQFTQMIGTGTQQYGLYCDNVFLNGALITSTEKISAGLNTKSEALFEYRWPKQAEKTTSSPIILWAGAPIREGKHIYNEAPFFVTEDGYLSANKGYFTGGLISETDIRGSKIYGSDIYAANIYGYDYEGENLAALSIHDANLGISFRKTVANGKTSEVFSIGQNGFKFINKSSQEEYFIDLQSGSPIFQAAKDIDSFLTFSKEGIISQDVFKDGTRINKGGLTVDNEGQVVMFSLEQQYASFAEDKIQFGPSVQFGYENNYVQYVRNFTEGGYDLYVSYDPTKVGILGQLLTPVIEIIEEE